MYGSCRLQISHIIFPISAPELESFTASQDALQEGDKMSRMMVVLPNETADALDACDVGADVQLVGEWSKWHGGNECVQEMTECYVESRSRSRLYDVSETCGFVSRILIGQRRIGAKESQNRSAVLERATSDHRSSLSTGSLQVCTGPRTTSCATKLIVEIPLHGNVATYVRRHTAYQCMPTHQPCE